MKVDPPTLIDLPNRIVVYGVTGSGKSTLARNLAQTKDLPYIDIDALAYRPHWEIVPRDEQRANMVAICTGDSWIIDTMYSQWMDVPLSRLQLMICLDYPRWVSLGRLIRRTTARMVIRQKVCGDNYESVRNLFSSNSIFVWHFKSFTKKRQRIHEWATLPKEVPVVVFTSSRQAETWLQSLRLEASKPQPSTDLEP